MFARPGEPEPNCIVGERLQPPEARPRRERSRTSPRLAGAAAARFGAADQPFPRAPDLGLGG
jgi:hypothetical protein